MQPHVVSVQLPKFFLLHYLECMFGSSFVTYIWTSYDITCKQEINSNTRDNNNILYIKVTTTQVFVLCDLVFAFGSSYKALLESLTSTVAEIKLLAKVNKMVACQPWQLLLENYETNLHLLLF